MISPSFNSFSLQSDSVITEEIIHRTPASRKIETQEISKRSGVKLINEDWRAKEIEIKGKIIGDTPDDLRDKVDTFIQNITPLQKSLIIEENRTYTATATEINIPDRSYNQSICEFGLRFLCADPFAVGDLISAGFIVPSGVYTITRTIGISGCVFVEPVITVTISGVAPSQDSSLRGLTLTYGATGEAVTYSGVLNYGDAYTFNYENYQVTVSGVQKQFSGIFSEWEVGDQTLTLTTSGSNTYRVDISYNKRYY